MPKPGIGRVSVMSGGATRRFCAIVLVALVLPGRWASAGDVNLSIPAAKTQGAALAKAAVQAPASRKVEGRLEHLRNRVASEASARAQARGPQAAKGGGLGLSDLSQFAVDAVKDTGAIQVYAVVDGVSQAAEERLRAAGMEVELAVDEINTYQGWVHPDQLDGIAGLEFVQRVQLPDYAVARTGSVNSQGDALLNADDVRALPLPGPYDGTGTTVGVISDGITHYASAVATGDLPASITVHPTISGSGDEGTAILEIVHDLAPGAALCFGGPSTSAEMVALIGWMANTANCNVICDDLGFYTEPYFEDGAIAQAARNAVTASGRVYCTAAGNDAVAHYQGLYSNPGAGYQINGLYLHNFKAAGGVDQLLNLVTVPRGGAVVVCLEWDDPFGASGNDYDIYIVDSGFTQILGVPGDAAQDGNDDPVEVTYWVNNSGKTKDVVLGIVLYSGVPKTLELFSLYEDLADDDATSADCVFGHAGVEEVISCGTINASDPGTDTIAYYSSLGPSTIAYPASEIRQTPFITGVDGVSITGAGGFYNPFYGTSAAEPHLAALAALLLDKEPLAPPEYVRNSLAYTARDRGAAGFDFTYGYGLADALGAVNHLIPRVASVVCTGATPTGASSVGFRVTFDDAVSGVSTSAPYASFALTTSGVSGAAITQVSVVNAATYTVTVGTGTGSGTIRLDALDDNTILNPAGNALGGPDVGDGNFTTGGVYTVDRTRPTVLLASSALSRTNVSPIPVIATFSEPVTGFDLADILVSNAHVENLSGSDAAYAFDLFPAAQGTVSARVRTAAARDAAGNTSTASNTLSRTYDTTPPAVLSVVRTSTNPTRATSVLYRVPFSESVTGVDTTDFVLTTTGVTGAYVYSMTGSGAAYSVRVATGTGSGTIRLDVADDDSIQDLATNPLGGTGAGNGNFTAGQVYTIDKTRPTVSMSSTAPDPTSVSQIPVIVTFSEPVTGFVATDIVPGSATISNFSGSGADYSFDLVPLAPGTVRADIPAGRAMDAVGNTNLAAPRFSRTYSPSP